MKKNKWNNVLKPIIFIFVIIFIVYFTVWVFCPKEMAYYDEPANEYEVLFFGSSTVYTSINPLVIFEKSGIKSYNLARPEQSISSSYYYMVEALKYQKPKLMVLDLYALFFYGEYPDDINPAGGVAAASINGLRLSDTKREFVEKVIKDEDTWDDYLMPWMSSHNNWKTGLGEESFKKAEEPYKGYVPSYNSSDCLLKSLQNPYIETWSAALNENNLDYLTKIVKLCNENDVPLLLIKTPQTPDWNYSINCHAALKNYCSANNLFVLNFNGDEEWSGVTDFAKDYSDGVHMNVYGAEHFSTALAKYIVKTYPDVTDYRKSDTAGEWYEKIDAFKAEKAEKLASASAENKPDEGEEEIEKPEDEDTDKSIWPWITSDQDFIDWLLEKLISHGNDRTVNK